MKNFLLTLTTLFFCSTFCIAQTKADLKPCGTPPFKTQWMIDYESNPASFPRCGTTLYVPLTIHIVGSDTGLGYYSELTLLDALCTLNADFEDSEIQFFIEGDINYINNTAWYNHSTVIEGAEMMFANNVENTINTYFVSDPAGNCGYNLPYAGVAMAKGCSDADSHTWAHEIGHNLSIQHPFLGWEGGVSYDGSVVHSYSNPAPTTVLYDYTLFKDVQYLDTLIIDTAYVELVDGSNCVDAADHYCDSTPDYLNYRWDCNDDNESMVVQTDPNGETFRSDGSLFMSYSFDHCQSRFTEGQGLGMQANLMTEKADYLYNQTPELPVTGVPVLLLPEDEEIVQFDEVMISWDAVPNATHYLLQVSRVAGFDFLAAQHITTETSILETELNLNKDYFWRVRAFNSHSFCAPISSASRFTTGELIATENLPNIEGLAIYPALLHSGQELYVDVEATTATNVQLNIVSISGQVLRSENRALKVGHNALRLGTNQLSAGMYLIGIEKDGKRFYQKVIIQD